MTKDGAGAKAGRKAGKTRATARANRLEAALRENLKKRKQQARSRRPTGKDAPAISRDETET